jgi:hypothetical protein
MMGWLACLAFIVVSLPITWYCRGERSAWVTILVPGDSFTDNNPALTLLGYNVLLGPEPVMVENEPSMMQVAFFSGLPGSEARLDFYAFRAIYSFFATLLTPLTGIISAMLVVNWCAWALCAWVAWHLSTKLFDDRLAAFFTVMFVAVGMGMITHIHDYSAHLLSFASYYLGVYLLYGSGILFERKPWRTHLMLGTYLAVACLVYNTGIMLTAVYILAALRRNRIRHVAGATLLALTALPLWRTALRLSGAEIPDVEGEVLVEALRGWYDLFQQPWWTIAETVAGYISEFALFDSPLVVLLGLSACLFLPRKREVRWFGAAVLGMPVLASLVFCTSSMNLNRGYLVYGASIWVYCWLGWLPARINRYNRWLGLITGICLCLTIGSQFAWSTAYLSNRLGPLKTYLMGWRMGLQQFVHPRPEVQSMTGFEGTPVLLGGKSSLEEAGPFIWERQQDLGPDSASFAQALVRRMLICAYLGLLGCTWMNSRRGCLLIGGGIGAAALLSAGLSWSTFHTMPVFNPLTDVRVAPRASLVYEVELAPSFLESLEGGLEDGDVLEFFVGYNAAEPLSSVADVSVTAGSTALGVNANDALSAFQALADAGRFTVEVVNRTDQSLNLLGWQRRGLQGRKLVVGAAVGPDAGELSVLPAVEIRLRRKDGSLRMIGF